MMTQAQPGKDTAIRADVCAVIYGETSGSKFAALRDALDAQTLSPAIVLRAPGLSAAARAAAATSPDVGWVWLLDGCTTPAPAALAQLLVVADEIPQPVLLVSKVLDRQGRLVCDQSLRHEVFEKERTVAAVGRGLVHLRSAGHGSVLVARSALRRIGMPRADLDPSLDMLEWSARLLRSWEDSGYLVTASVAIRETRPEVRSQWWARARLLSGGAWAPSEKLWEAFLLGQAAAGTIRRRAHGREATGAPGRNPSRRPRRMTGSARRPK
jgi:hypothetical protein